MVLQRQGKLDAVISEYTSPTPVEGFLDPDDLILFARRSGLRAAPRSGGHCFSGRSSTGGVVVDVSRMRSVSVEEGVATVGAGTRLGDLYDALDGHGLTIPAAGGVTGRMIVIPAPRTGFGVASFARPRALVHRVDPR